jgi:hypothetical protein
MIYLVQTIKELWEKKINTDLVIQSDNEENIKQLMSEYKIIVLWIKKVNWWPISAQIFWIIEDKNHIKYNFCIKSDSLEWAIRRCIDLELSLISIHSNKENISEKDAFTMIQTIIQTNNIEKQQALEKQQQETKKRKELTEDKRKDKVMIVIGETLQDISKIEQDLETESKIISWDKKKKLHELKELLTKIKMWSNLEKATNVLEETFTLMELIETEGLSQMKEEEQKIISSSVVSNIDIISELDKLKRANQTSSAGTKKNSSDLYYTYLGISWLYQKFIIKDIINKLLETKKVIIYGIEYIWFGIICISTYLGWVMIYNDINQSLQQDLFIMMISIWIFGLARELPLIVRKSSFMISVIYIILAIIISIIIQKLLIINFALI